MILDFGVQFSFKWSCHSTLVCPVADQLKVPGEAACTYSRRSRGGRDTLAAVICTSWPARRCPGIRAPRWSWSLRSPSSAELSRLPITPSRGEHTPLWRKLLFDRWTCIIQLSLLEKWLGSLNIFVFITDKRKRARKKELLLKLQHNIAASLPPWLNPTLSLRDRSTHGWTYCCVFLWSSSIKLGFSDVSDSISLSQAVYIIYIYKTVVSVVCSRFSAARVSRRCTPRSIDARATVRA